MLNSLSQLLSDPFPAILDEENRFLRLGLDRAEMIDRKRCWMKTYLFVIWSEDDTEKSIIRSQVFGSPGLLVLIRYEDLGRYVPLSFENTMLNLVNLRGVKGIKHVFLKDHASFKF